MVENFHLDLAAVSVTRERQLDAQLGGAMERIGIVGEENVGHVSAHEGLNIRQNLLALDLAEEADPMRDEQVHLLVSQLQARFPGLQV